jgi:thiol-disulfide isomerase/thioredoxin
MKKISIFFYVLLWCLINPVFSQKIHFESSLEAAFTKAKAQNKIVFVEYYNSTCTICISIEPLFSDPKIASFYNEHFISYKMNTRDGLKDEEQAFLNQQGLHFQGVPYFLFFDQNNTFLHYSGAKADVEYVLQIAKTVLNPNERSAHLIEKYNSGDRSIRTLYGYINLLQVFKESTLLNTLSAELYEVYPKQNLHTHQSFLILKNAVFSIENGFFRYWYEHRDKLVGMDKGNAKDKELKILENIVLNELKSDAKMEWSLTKIEEVKNMITSLNITDTPDEFLWEAEVVAYQRENNTHEVLELLNRQIQKNEKNIYGLIYVMDYFLTKSGEQNILNAIQNQLKEEIKKNHSPDIQGDLMLLKLQLLKKSNMTKEFQELKIKTEAFFKIHKLDESELTSL